MMGLDARLEFVRAYREGLYRVDGAWALGIPGLVEMIR